MLAYCLWHEDLQELLLSLLSQLVMGYTVAYINNDQHCFAVDLVHQDLPSSIQTHQVSCILPPLYSVLPSFTRQWFGTVLCAL
jgi:hypothetical protein